MGAGRLGTALGLQLTRAGYRVQEIIPGDGKEQYSVAAYCKDGTMLASMTARRTRQYPIDFGRGSTFVEAIEVPNGGALWIEKRRSFRTEKTKNRSVAGTFAEDSKVFSSERRGTICT